MPSPGLSAAGVAIAEVIVGGSSMLCGNRKIVDSEPVICARGIKAIPTNPESCAISYV